MSELVDVGGYRLAAEISGLAGGPWITLSNSLGTTRRMWDPQLPLLEPHFQVLRYDTRGHGESDVPPGPYDLEGLADDVVRLLDHFAIDRTDFIGLSIGGMTALGLALDHPDRLGRAICADARADATPAYVKAWDERAEAMDRGGLAAIWPMTRERWLIAAPGPVVEKMKGAYLAMPVEGLKACGKALQGLNYFHRLGDITTPMLYIGGDSDAGAAPEVMRAMAAATPGSSHHIVAKAAHISNVDNPADFNAAVARFLGIAAP
jgi:3-oxoadipate enol-lactonase